MEVDEEALVAADLVDDHRLLEEVLIVENVTTAIRKATSKQSVERRSMIKNTVLIKQLLPLLLSMQRYYQCDPSEDPHGTHVYRYGSNWFRTIDRCQTKTVKGCTMAHRVCPIDP